MSSACWPLLGGTKGLRVGGSFARSSGDIFPQGLSDTFGRNIPSTVRFFWRVEDIGSLESSFDSYGTPDAS
jgi:hypothetical protein